MMSSQDLKTETMRKSGHLKMKSSLHSCSHCGKMLTNRFNMLRHEEKCQSNIQVSPPSTTIADAVYEQTEEINKIKREVTVNTTKRCRDMKTEIIPKTNNIVDNEQQDANLEPPTKRGRRRVFISTEEFNRLVNNSTVKWSDLSRDCIYKLEKIYYDINQQPLVNLSNSDGVTISTVTPNVVMEKLLSLSETDVTIYVRLNGEEEQVDIVTLKKQVCTTCKKSFNSRNGLWNHQRKYCAEKKTEKPE